MQSNNKKTRIINSKRGFTMIEALVAIMLLSVSVVGPLTVASRGLSAAQAAKDQIEAIFLAQEVIEYVKNKRDENILAGNTAAGDGDTGWLNGLANCRNATSCYIDVPNNTVPQDCAIGITNDCPVMKYDTDTGLYGYGVGGTNSIFTREVTLSAVNSVEEAIEVVVSWTTNSTPRTLKIRSTMFKFN